MKKWRRTWTDLAVGYQGETGEALRRVERIDDKTRGTRGTDSTGWAQLAVGYGCWAEKTLQRIEIVSTERIAAQAARQVTEQASVFNWRATL